MKLQKRKLFVVGLLASAMTFVGCQSDISAARESPYEDNSPLGSGHISETKQSDDNLRMPLEDPLRTRQRENVRAAAVEPNVEEAPGEETFGTGGSGNPGKAQQSEDKDCR